MRGSKTHPNNKGFLECVEVLKAAGAKNDERGDVQTKDIKELKNEPDAAMALTAAASGDVTTLVHMAAAGSNIFAQDYDARTAIHLASSNGQTDALNYLIAQIPHSAALQEANSEVEKSKATLALLNAQDRFLGTPIEDADREHHAHCWKILHQLTERHQKVVDGK